MNAQRFKKTNEITQYSSITLQLTEMIRQFVYYNDPHIYDNDNSYDIKNTRCAGDTESKCSLVRQLVFP